MTKAPIIFIRRVPLDWMVSFLHSKKTYVVVIRRLIAIADPHRLRLVTYKANRRSQTAVRQGTIAVGAPVQRCTVTGVHKLENGARRGQSKRQRSHQTAEQPPLRSGAIRQIVGVGAQGGVCALIVTNRYESVCAHTVASRAVRGPFWRAGPLPPLWFLFSFPPSLPQP